MIYFDLKRDRQILQSDVCDLSTWTPDQFRNFSCARHKEGFLIFLEPEKIEISNEYKDGDPYTVSKNIMSSFHQRRFTDTITLLKKVSGVDCAKILDLGCGEGHLTGLIRQTFPASEIHGLDYSIDAIRIANREYKNINYVVADAYFPPFVTGYFDVVVLNNLWEHVADPLLLLRSIERLLCPGGVVIISTPSRYRISNLVRVMIGREVAFMSKLHVTEYSIGQVKEQLKFGGFKVTDIYSNPIRESRLALQIFKVVFRLWLRLSGSHHQLESTIFYLATKIG